MTGRAGSSPPTSGPRPPSFTSSSTPSAIATRRSRVTCASVGSARARGATEAIDANRTTSTRARARNPTPLFSPGGARSLLPDGADVADARVGATLEQLVVRRLDGLRAGGLPELEPPVGPGDEPAPRLAEAAVEFYLAPLAGARRDLRGGEEELRRRARERPAI